LPSVRLAHEALINGWQRARDQLAADRRDLETRTLVERQFGRWRQARGRARRLLLLRNPDLANAADLARRWGDELGPVLRDFIKRSSRRARLAQTLVAAAAGLFALVAGGAFYAQRLAVRAQQEANREREQALHARQDADSQAEQARLARTQAERRQVGLMAELATSERLRGAWDTAMKLGVHAAQLATIQGAGAMAAPRTSLATTMWESNLRLTLSSHGNAVGSAAFSPDGSRILTASKEDGVRLWNADDGKEIAAMAGSEATFSPDGRRIVTTGEQARIVQPGQDDTVRTWDGATGTPVAVMRGHAAGFSPDGNRVVTALADNTAAIWDAATGTQLTVLRGHTDSVAFVAFTPDGSRILTTSVDETARVWDAATGRQTAVLQDSGAVLSAVFSPDGSRILTVRELHPRVWDAATGTQIATLSDGDETSAAAFSPDGSRIVTASSDRTVRIWDAATTGQIAVLRGHESAVWAVMIEPISRHPFFVVRPKVNRISRLSFRFLWNFRDGFVFGRNASRGSDLLQCNGKSGTQAL
jgi:WD domain, G-beta repeat